jgi:hypothetical protein
MAKNGSGGTRADQGVRPTFVGFAAIFQKTSGIKLKRTLPVESGLDMRQLSRVACDKCRIERRLRDDDNAQDDR